MERLSVWFHGVRAGSLEYDGTTNSFVFAYDDSYLAAPESTPISASLPLSTRSFDPYTSRKFFENLLPPEVVRRKLETVLHVSVGNVFGCLKAIGRDCAGAVSVYPDGEQPVDSGDEQLLELSEVEAEAALRELSMRPLLADAYDGFRMSAAGAQDKVIARVRDGRLLLPLYGAASTDILKPAVARLPESVFNELFCQRLASEFGIVAAECGVIRFGSEVCYRTRRYDRYEEGGRVRRWHQEDFCQILGMEAEQKYQEEGGPSIARCLSAIRSMRLGFEAQLGFLRQVIFNCLIGNTDAHGKNYSVLYRGGRAEIAPLYDAMSTMVYDGATSRMAMRIGNALTHGELTRESFRELSGRCDVNERLLLDELDKISERILGVIEPLAERLSDEGNHSPVYDKIKEVIKETVKRTGK